MLDFLYKNLFEILTVIAILVGPFIGIWTQKKIERIKEHKSRQRHIFETLMATRGTPLAKEYVAALNLIEMNFSDTKRKEKPVIDAWRLLLDQFESYPDDEEAETNPSSATQIVDNLADQYAIDLLFEMSKFLGYNFKKTDIKNGWYVPDVHDEDEKNKKIIREELVNLLTGEKPLDINVKD